MLYNSLLFFNKIESSIRVDKWVSVLDIQEKSFMKLLYQFFFIFGRKQTENIEMEVNTIHNSCQKIIISMENCGNEEDYLHYFITCSFFKTLWEKIYNHFKSNNLEITLKLKHLIFGYKISDQNYYRVNYFITINGPLSNLC